MNETINRQLNHRSIREFKDADISDEIRELLLNIANRTATSNGMQAFSIIRITDKEKKAKIAEICKQDYVNRVPEFWIFITDQYRNAKIALEQDCFEDTRGDMDRFLQGYTDAAISAQNVVVAAESLGLGTVFFGSILNDSEEIVNLLNLPIYTFPVVGLGMGYPNQEPQLKPRMELSLKVFENEYKEFDSYLDAIKDYDKVLSNYYDLRDTSRRVDSFSKQVVTKLQNPIEKRSKIFDVVRKQGYDMMLTYLMEDEIKKMYKNAPKDMKEDLDFHESVSGLKLDTMVADLFEKFPYVEDYLLMINPKFNKLKTVVSAQELRKMTLESLANLAEMPADSLIYMIESRISEE
ncbi:NADPH-dependent oxidoreductase [Peptostreptococcus equinus]|uniref:NADPH-dependent oxidoreductase n=1 Tax=Peptostreptococcus equinus TaxID=3003601 RepID=A0ABY7JPL2_9FIRM|nr:NADPH-dependent oxidoreductase [Peptostreptococcus sp. CBA3647]WAW14431.1 NADPH-dependent oxidoreductase [Peptostreptococcus sp. CBA3647]